MVKLFTQGRIQTVVEGRLTAENQTDLLQVSVLQLRAEATRVQGLLRAEATRAQGLLRAEAIRAQGLLRAEATRAQGLLRAEVMRVQELHRAEAIRAPGLLRAEVMRAQGLLRAKAIRVQELHRAAEAHRVQGLLRAAKATPRVQDLLIATAIVVVRLPALQVTARDPLPDGAAARRTAHPPLLLQNRAPGTRSQETGKYTACG
jgi:hypothetical protein